MRFELRLAYALLRRAGEGSQQPADVLRMRGPLSQALEQRRHGGAQIDERANEAAPAGQVDALLKLLARLSLATKVRCPNGLQCQHGDLMAQIVLALTTFLDFRRQCQCVVGGLLVGVRQEHLGRGQGGTSRKMSGPAPIFMGVAAVHACAERRSPCIKAMRALML